MNYSRVIPRDFFNEAKLLKCMGVLSLKVLDNTLPAGISITIDDESGDSFDVQLTDDGILFVANYPVKINGERVFIGTTYNSKAAYPCVIVTEDYTEITVFTEAGEFDEEFINTFTSVPA